MPRQATGTVRARRDCIQVGYTRDGQRHWIRVDLKPTKANLDAVRRHIDEYIGIHSGASLEFAAACQEYLDTADLAFSTLENAKSCLQKYWLPRLAGRDIHRITYRDLNQIDQETPWPSHHTRKLALRSLRGVWKSALTRAGLPWKNSPPWEMASGGVKNGTPDPYDRDERARIATLSRTLSKPSSTFFAVAFGTGTRTGEILGLQWTDLSDTTLVVSRSVVRRRLKSTKTGEERRMLIPDWLSEYLEPLRGEGAIVSTDGEHMPNGNRFAQELKAMCRELGIRERTGPYPWRHTYASLALMDGASPGFVAQQLGHSEAVMRQHYARWIPSEQDRIELEKMRWAEHTNRKKD